MDLRNGLNLSIDALAMFPREPVCHVAVWMKDKGNRYGNEVVCEKYMGADVVMLTMSRP